MSRTMFMVVWTEVDWERAFSSCDTTFLDLHISPSRFPAIIGTSDTSARPRRPSELGVQIVPHPGDSRAHQIGRPAAHQHRVTDCLRRVALDYGRLLWTRWTCWYRRGSLSSCCWACLRSHRNRQGAHLENLRL